MWCAGVVYTLQLLHHTLHHTVCLPPTPTHRPAHSSWHLTPIIVNVLTIIASLSVCLFVHSLSYLPHTPCHHYITAPPHRLYIVRYYHALRRRCAGADTGCGCMRWYVWCVASLIHSACVRLVRGCSYERACVGVGMSAGGQTTHPAPPHSHVIPCTRCNHWVVECENVGVWVCGCACMCMMWVVYDVYYSHQHAHLLLYMGVVLQPLVLLVFKSNVNKKRYSCVYYKGKKFFLCLPTTQRIGTLPTTTPKTI